MRRSSSLAGALFVLLLFLLIPLGFLYWMWGENIIHSVVTTFREFGFFFIPAVIAMVLAGVLYFFDFRAGSAFVVAVGLILGVIFSIPAEYNTKRGYYEASTQTFSGTVTPSYEERAPFEVASLTSDKNLMDITGNSQITKSLPDEGKSGEWNTLVVERGWFKGYEVVQNLNVPLFGTAQNNNVEFCEFSDNAKLRNGGAVPSNNLSRAIYHETPMTVDFDSEDLYSYCNEDDEPVVVVPLKKITGFLYARWVPYGVAVYNGKSGELKIVRDSDDISEIPGPTYPLSLAKTQRESLIANGSWTEMVIEQVSGYVEASENTEVALRRTDNKGSDYVTALMPRGSSTSIIATSSVTATGMTPGEYNELVVNLLPAKNVRPANSTLIDDLKTRYSYMPDMANDTIKVFEITAGKDGGWVMSLGRDQSVNYRAYVSSSGDKVELYDRNGNLMAEGSRSKEQDNEGTETGSSAPSINFDGENLSELSSEELNELGKAIMDEMAKRSK